MDNCTDLYFINKRLAICEVWVASCLLFVALGTMLIVSSWIFLKPADLVVGFITVLSSLIVAIEFDTERYYWLAAKERIL